MECNGNKYPIRVVEEQVVINQFMKVDCDCRVCGLRRSEEKDYDIDIEKGEDHDVVGANTVNDVVAADVGESYFPLGIDQTIENIIEKMVIWY